MRPPRTVVFGLDGASFELIQPWLEAGELPNVERAIGDGITGNLESVLPPVTSPNWKAYATGKNPGKLGIFWWENIDVDRREVYYPTDRKNAQAEFWELIGESDGAGVIGVPTTYPPKSLDGFVVAGAPDGSDDGYAAPPELEQRLETEFDYRVLKQNRMADEPDATVSEIHDLIESRFEIAEELLEDYDVGFLQVTTFYLNSLHHFLWDDERTLEGWRIVDRHLGRFLDSGRDVVLMSDHGSNPVTTVFHINSWLEHNGYLATETGVADMLHGAGINADRLFRLADAVGAGRAAKRLAPDWVLHYLPRETGELESRGKMGAVDWEATEVVASGQGPLYLTADKGTPRYDRLRSDLIESLTGLTAPSGDRVVETVHRAEDVYEGPYLDEAPDLVIEQASGTHIPGTVGRESVFSAPADDGWVAENKRAGLFVATGPSFDTGSVYGLSILDLAPTLLHLHGYAVPTDMDGSVRSELFASESEPATRAVTRRPTDSGIEAERRRIRQIAKRSDL